MRWTITVLVDDPESTKNIAVPAAAANVVVGAAL
jgi:hypothetical protein